MGYLIVSVIDPAGVTLRLLDALKHFVPSKPAVSGASVASRDSPSRASTDLLHVDEGPLRRKLGPDAELPVVADSAEAADPIAVFQSAAGRTWRLAPAGAAAVDRLAEMGYGVRSAVRPLIGAIQSSDRRRPANRSVLAVMQCRIH